MIRSLFAVCFTLALGTSLAGCGNSPESMCKKFTELEKKAGKGKEDKDGKGLEKCVKEMTEMKEKNPKQYECAAPCADKGTYDEAFACFLKCSLESEDTGSKK